MAPAPMQFTEVAQKALGAETLDPEHVEVFPVSDLEGVGLAGYLEDGMGVPADQLEDMRARALTPDVISYSAAMSACEKGGEWEWAPSLLTEMRDLDPAVRTPTPTLTPTLTRTRTPHPHQVPLPRLAHRGDGGAGRHRRPVRRL